VHVSEARRILPRAASAVLLSASVAVLSVPAAQSASRATPARAVVRTTPADLYRGQQWTLDALHIPRAWKYSRGNGVTVAVLDTGVDGNQPDLSGRVVDGPDFTGHARKPGNKYWGRHGTEMASLIAGHGHGAGGSAGVMGVAPDAKILSIRVTWELNDPIRTDNTQVDRARDAVANGIHYAVDHGAQVISMSLGGGNLFYNGNANEAAAIKYALGKGAVLVASAGNDGNGANRRNYPAAYPGVIAVGAVDRTFKAANFTNRHTYISVAAPGVEIVSADASGHGYILGTGTSSSAAFVAGMSALVKARYPSLTPAEVKQALEEGATHRPPDGRSSEIGTGVADAYGALRTAAGINKAEHGGATVNQPASTARPASQGKSGPDLLLIAVLSGGGTLILLSLILGWRQRRRRPAHDTDDEEFEEPAAVPVPARTSSRSEPSAWDRRPGEAPPPRRPSSSGTSSGRSPWERRPPEAQGEDMWELGASPSTTGPWDRRDLPAAPRSDWDRPADPAETAGPAETAEPPPAEGRHRSESPGWDHEDVWNTREDRNGTAGEAVSSGSAWDLPPAEPLASAWDGPAAEPPASAWDQSAAEPPASAWDQSAAEPPASAWDQSAAEPFGSAWDRPPAEPPAPEGPQESVWERAMPEPPGWDEPRAEAPPADEIPAEPPSASVWRDPQAEPPAGSRSPNLFDAMEPFQEGPYESPEQRDDPHRPPEPYEPLDDPLTTRPDAGGSNGRRPPSSRDFRVAGGTTEPDPLTDDRVDSSTDVGTPLADQSWDSIRRGFDRLKDASNWESLAKGDIHDAADLPAADAFDETAAMPVIDPDEDDGGRRR
jgi:serine protease